MRERSRARHVFHAIAIVVGLVALGFLVDQLGWAGIRAVLAGAGPWFLAIALLDLISVAFDTLAIRQFLGDVRPSYARTFAAQASGVAINRLTPGHSAGEAVKVTMLMDSVPSTAALSAIVMFNLATISIAVASILVGIPLTLLLVDVPGRTQLVVWIAAGGLLVAIVALLTLARRRPLHALISLARRVRLLSHARASALQEKAAITDERIRQFGRRGSRAGIGFVMASRCSNWVGTVCVIAAVDAPLTAPIVIAMLTVGILIYWMSNVIPLGLGIADATNYALYGALGSTGALGLAFTMINRARTCVLAMMGLLVMLVANLVDRSRSRSR